MRFKCFNVNFRLLKTIYVHLLVCYLNTYFILACWVVTFCMLVDGYQHFGAHCVHPFGDENGGTAFILEVETDLQVINREKRGKEMLFI